MASSDVAIACEGLSKRYKVKAVGAGRKGKEDFWALRDINFEVPVGEVVGVVGRNGAGKSTLLKVLSRIVQPTMGTARMRGRLTGLLEVGTGFHPELTGRENVFLNGTILGMTRREVQRQFDSIVDFAGISYFLDTPIKRYSSGMYVRLAFAVAAHLQSDIMVLDEVLAVGDVAFQRKCLGKVQELAHDQGRTVLLVSHNAAVIRETATSALRLEKGRLAFHGSVKDVLEEDELHTLPVANLSGADRADPNWGQVVRLLSASVADGGRIRFGDDLTYQVRFEARREVMVGVGQAVITPDDTPLAASFSSLEGYPVGTHTVDVTIAAPPLGPGRYALNIVIGQASFAAPDLHYDGVMHAVSFEVLDEELTIDWHPEWWGAVVLAEPTVKLRPSDA